MGFEKIDVPELPLPGQFSHVVRKGKMVFISGQTADNEGAAGNLDPYAHAETFSPQDKSNGPQHARDNCTFAVNSCSRPAALRRVRSL